MLFFDKKLDLNNLLDLTPYNATDYFDEDEINIELLLGYDGLFYTSQTRQSLCKFFGVQESTLSGWRKSNKVPQTARAAYMLLYATQVLIEEVKGVRAQLEKERSELKIIKMGDTYSICQFSQEKTTNFAKEKNEIGEVIANNIPTLKKARMFAQAHEAFKLLHHYMECDTEQLERWESEGNGESAEWIRERRSCTVEKLRYIYDHKSWSYFHGSEAVEREKKLGEEIRASMDKISEGAEKNKIEEVKEISEFKPFNARYQVCLLGDCWEAKSRGELVASVHKKLADYDDNYLQKISKEKSSNTSRARYLVANTPEDIYKNCSENVKNDAEKHAEKICDGWYCDGNISHDQLEAALEISCEIIGIKYKIDLIVDDRKIKDSI